MMTRIATDIGGTFTDLVYVKTMPGGHSVVGTAKSHTTPSQFEQGVMDVIAASQTSPREFVSFVHGTTIVINAITEKKGVKTALITSQGFRDVLEIGRGNRPDYFNLDYVKPSPFVERYLRREVPGRINYKGIETSPLDLSGLPVMLDDFRTEGVEAIAICLLNAYANDSHEQAVYEQVQTLWPGAAVVASHQITREWREYERTNTTVLSAYVQPIAHRYLDDLTGRLSTDGMTCVPLIMQSNCGVDTIANTRAKPIAMIESGPASGVLGAAALGQLIDEPDVIAIDIGGTTAKCSLIRDGQVALNTNYFVEQTALSGGYPIMVPVVDLVEIGQGGGSIAWVDDFHHLHVGPQSAGADPGPVAYGMGGTAATTTDANLALGCINPDYFCGGTLTADMNAVHQSLDTLSTKLNLPRSDVARGIVRLANNNMVNAIKLISVNRGYDPRDFTLIAFGGGGGMHACALARELGIQKVIIPHHAGVFSAWGMLLSDLRRDYLQTQIVDLSSEDAANQLNQQFAALEAQAIAAYAAEQIDAERVYCQRYGRLRYQNQEHSTEIDLPSGTITSAKMRDIIDHFHATYEREYTYRLDAPVELVTFHVIAFAKVDKLLPQPLPSPDGTMKDTVKGQRLVDYLEDGIHEATIYDGAQMSVGMSFVGPAVVEEADTTVVIPPGMVCEADRYGNYVVTASTAR
ncbi:MAG: hydantoinase/oxoprolinase family protein [Chloroflexota bacterium]